MGLPKVIPKWAFLAISGVLVLAAAAVSVYWAVTFSGIYEGIARAFADRDGSYDLPSVLAATFLTVIVPLLPIILLLRAFSRVPSFREQFQDLERHLGLRPSTPVDPTTPSVGSRIAAFLIDRFLAVMMLMVCIVPAIFLREAAGLRWWVVVAIVTALVPGIFYAWARDAFGGRSIARRLLKQRVVDAATRRPIGAGRSFLRELMLHLGPLPILELVLLGTRPDRRRLGDHLAKTIVIRDPPKI